MRWLLTRVCASACGGAAWLLAAAALAAEPTAADRTLAQGLFEQGRAFMAAKNYAAACPKFAESQRLDPSPGTLLNLAVCHEQTDLLATAWAEFNDAAALARSAGEGARETLARSRARAIEPKLAHLTVKAPAAITDLTMTLDGAPLGSAALGTPLPADAGTHKLIASRAGKEVWSTIVVIHSDGDAVVAQVPDDVAGATTSSQTAPSSPAQSASPASTGAPTPPPPVEGTAGEPAEKGSRTALLMGLTLGMELPIGDVPAPTPGNGGVNFGKVSGAGIAGVLNVALRFERHWFVGGLFEYAGFGQGSDLSSSLGAGASKETSQTMQFGAVLGFIVNPDKVSFLGEAGISYRWYEYAWTDSANTAQKNQFNTAELLLGMGVPVPVGRTFRIVPEATLNLGSFASGATTSGHALIMLGVGGFFDVAL